MLAYIKDPAAKPFGARLTLLFSFLHGVGGLLVAALILLGWIALGDRINISRRDINIIEWVGVFLSVLYAMAALRTAYGLRNRTEAGWAWSQWFTFINIFIGVALIMKGALPHVVAYLTGSTAPPLQWGWIAVGLGLVVINLLLYSYVTRDRTIDDTKTDKKQGALGTEATDMTPGQFMNFQLAKSPSAGAIIGFVVIFLGFSFATDLFLQQNSIASFLTNISTKGIIAIGVTILMISGEFDLSVGSMLGAVATFYMLFMTEGIPALGIEPMPILVASIAALGVACFLGFINGFILVRTGIPSFIVTLGTLLIYRAIPLVAIPGGRILRYRDYYDDFPQVHIERTVMALLAGITLLILAYIFIRVVPNMVRKARQKWEMQHNAGHFGSLSASWSWIRTGLMTALLIIIGVWLIFVITYHLEQPDPLQVGFFDIANGRWEFSLQEVTRDMFSIDIRRDANFRNSIVWWLILVGIFHVVMTQTRYGNSVFAVGGNEGAARAQGIDVNRTKVLNFMLVAFLVGIAAILEVARNPGVDPLKGEGWELEVIAMTVIGGALLSGGYGSIIGTLLGALIFGILQTGLVLIGVNARLFQGVVGIILIVAVVLNTTVRRIPNR